MAGFLVPFLSGGLIKAQEIRDEYDENAGKFIDAANALYKEKFNKNQKAIELQNANYAAVKNSLGVPLAEIAAKQGLLGEVPTAKIVGYVQSQFSKSFIDNLNKRVKAVDDKGNPTFKLSDLGYQTLFSEDIKTARDSLTSQRKWAAKNLNRGAIKNVADLYLAGDEELPEPTGLEKAKSFMFGDRVTESTGVAFDQAAAEKIGKEVLVQPQAVDLKSSIADTIGYQESVIAGSINDVNKSISYILGLSKNKGITIDVNNNFTFEARFKPNANAIRSYADKIADTNMYTTADGKPDTAAIVEQAYELVQTNIINKSKNNWTNLDILNKDVFNKRRSLTSSGISKSFQAELEKNVDEFDINTDIQVEQKTQIAKRTKRKADVLPEKQIATGNYLVSDKVSNYIINQVNKNLGYKTNAEKALYVDYIPDNIYVQVTDASGNPAKMKLKLYVEQALQLRQF